MKNSKVVSARILIEGRAVQDVGYRIFLLERALENGIERVYARNVGKNKVKLLVKDEEDKVDRFYQVVKSDKPEKAVVEAVEKEPYGGKVPIPPIERYFQFLTLEQLTRGREEVLKVPRFVESAVSTVATALQGIDQKFGAVAERFGIFGDYAKKMDGKLAGMDEKLFGIGERLDTLPERIAKALSANEKKR